ncbi:isochorismatase family protein [Pseudonocardia spinosispora]|uniref:isochorismatase family protein n=1 Tax=Pseudonocardia spinosispora TaxID=103441 RepID=UPI001B7FA177|nr:isochorismatase family protein [Pseudonocardia spinosispora]
MSLGAAELYRERRIGMTQRPIDRPALVVVDLTYGFTDESSALGCPADDAVTATAQLLAAARQAGAPRIFTRIEYDSAGARAAAPFLEKMPALAECVVGSRWAQVDERVAPLPDEPVVSKLFASGFFGTELAALLAEHRCDGVVITGATTSGCVRATVVDAMQHGYRVLVPEPSVVDRAREPHDAALFDIQAKYGEVVSLDAARAVLARSIQREVR